MNICVVHDYLFQMGGAEKVVAELHRIYPEAPIYTSIYRPDRVSPEFHKMDIRTTFLQQFAWMDHHARKLLPLYPSAFENFNLEGYDVVLSSSSAFAKGVITPPGTLHICYCYTPMRFAWMYHAYIEREEFNRAIRCILPFMIKGIRTWDEASSSRVDHFIAISGCVADRIRKYYRREATIIYPPVDVKHFNDIPRNAGEYFLIVSRLVPYKRIDTAVKAFNSLGLPLKIAGNGRDLKSLRAIANSNIEFMGYCSHEEIRELYSRAIALLFPGYEDFGIVPVEAQAAGCPVIAYNGGGSRETIKPGVSGILYNEQTEDSLKKAVLDFDPSDYSVETLRREASRFDNARFASEITTFIEKACDDRRSRKFGRCLG